MFNTHMIINVFKNFFTKQIQDRMTNDIETDIIVINEWEFIPNIIVIDEWEFIPNTIFT